MLLIKTASLQKHNGLVFFYDENHYIWEMLNSLVKWFLKYFFIYAKRCWEFGTFSYILLCKTKTTKFGKFHARELSIVGIRQERFLKKNNEYSDKSEPKMRFSHQFGKPTFYARKNRIYPGRTVGRLVG